MSNNLFFAFKSKPFLNLWLAEIFTQIPVNLLNFLLILIVYNLTKSNTAVSGIVLSFTLPAVLFGIIAGIYIDRWNKKKVLFAANISRAILLILLAVFHEHILVIFIASFLITVITQFFIPAESPIIPLLVKKDQLLSANALFGIGIFGSILVAYLLSGPLLLSLGTVNTLVLLAVLLLIGAMYVSLIEIPVSEDKKDFSLKSLKVPMPIIKKELKAALKVIKTSKQITSSLFLLAMSQILILIIASIAPGYATEVLHIRVEQFPLLVVAPATVGIIVGAFIIANALQKIEKDHVVNVGILLSSVIMIVMPYGSKIASREFVTTLNQILPKLLHITNIDIIIFLAFILGVANALVFIPSNTILQEQTTDEMRGKIYGVLNTLVGIFSFIPIIAVGSFSDLIGVSRVLVGIGVSLFMVAVLKIIL